jgi:hypothetical protein
VYLSGRVDRSYTTVTTILGTQAVGEIHAVPPRVTSPARAGGYSPLCFGLTDGSLLLVAPAAAVAAWNRPHCSLATRTAPQPVEVNIGCSVLSVTGDRLRAH